MHWAQKRRLLKPGELFAFRPCLLFREQRTFLAKSLRKKSLRKTLERGLLLAGGGLEVVKVAPEPGSQKMLPRLYDSEDEH
jgi:hypothetical protein